jgi:hypothetical protein
MPMDNFNILSYDDISEYWEEREDGRETRSSVHNQIWYMVNFDTIRQVSDAFSFIIIVGNDDDLVASVYEFRGQLVYVAFDTAGLREEEVADHCDVVRRLGLGADSVLGEELPRHLGRRHGEVSKARLRMALQSN